MVRRIIGTRSSAVEDSTSEGHTTTHRRCFDIQRVGSLRPVNHCPHSPAPKSRVQQLSLWRFVLRRRPRQQKTRSPASCSRCCGGPEMTAACRDWVPLHPRRLRDEATLAQRLASVAQQMDEGGRSVAVLYCAPGGAGRPRHL